MTIAKLLYHPVTIFLVSLLVIIFYFSLDASSKKTQKSSENIAVLEHEVNQISKNVIDLEEKIQLSESEAFKEKVIRNELLLQKEGEIILQISDLREEPSNNNCDIDCVDCPECISTNTSLTPLQAWLELLL